MREEKEGNLGNIGRGNNFYWEWWECPIHHSLAVIGDGKGRGRGDRSYLGVVGKAPFTSPMWI